jgi:peptide-methionine (S)-S-oxide reductase
MLTKTKISVAALVLASFGWACRAGGADAANRAIPAPAIDMPAPEKDGLETVVLAGGCFWGLEGMFQHVKGVTNVVSGYSGGTKETATYGMVSSERTGHAEAVEITFNPRQVSYGQLLQLYFSVAHDPTQLNRQGPDTGPSYRSEIFFASPAQERVAKAYIQQLTEEKVFKKPIVTKVGPLQAFYPAEAYHQDFLILHPRHPYIVAHDLPKIAALKRTFPQLYSEKPAAL